MASNQTLESVDRDGIPELNNTNWPEWSYKMRNSLILMGLWDYVDQEPRLSTTNAEHYISDDLEKVRIAAKAQARILMRVPHCFKGILEGCCCAQPPRDTWRHEGILADAQGRPLPSPHWDVLLSHVPRRMKGQD
eukprot:scaffold957_cov322-Pavlova_lutheri.AAC.6